MKALTHISVFLILLLQMGFTGCAHHFKLPIEKKSVIYSAVNKQKNLIEMHAPVFRIYAHHEVYNRIGKASARYGAKGREKIFIDPDEPVIYYSQHTFTTEKGSYHNLVYRVHFPKIPFKIIPFNLTAGKNAGLMVVVTLNEQSDPVLITSVHTCGCYKAFVPTSHLPKDAYPLSWKGGTQDVYGEKLPSLLNFSGINHPKVVFYIRPGVHRITDIKALPEDILDDPFRYHKIPAELSDMNLLNTLSINGNFTSFYHRKGVMRGYVKGSVKPWESLLLSLISLDFFVGTDKAYEDPRESENYFYTSLKPWNRKTSDMWDFKSFLTFWGWRL